MNLWTSTTSKSSQTYLVIAAFLLLGVSSFSSAAAFSSRGRSTLAKNGSIPWSFRRPVLMVPRGGDSGHASKSVNSIETNSEPSSTTESTTTLDGRLARLLPRRQFAMVSPLAALRPVVSLYCAALNKNPIATNCATAAALSVASDAIAQSVERRGSTDSTKKHDTSRSLWMALWGFIMSGLMIHYWFIFLNGLFPVEGLTLVGALKKVMVNQLVMSPGLNGLFFTFATYTRGDVVGGDKKAFLGRKLATDLLPTIKRSCVYWGTVQLVNFLFVPTTFSVLYTNFGFLIWTTYISLVGYRKVATKQ